jgi:hypothetical protein
MAINRLAQSNPTADTDTLLHTSTRNAVVSIIATNTSSSAADVTMWTVPSGAGSAGYVYHAYESSLPGNNTLETFRFAIEDGDGLYVKSSTAFVSFSLNGIYETNGTSSITVAALSASPTENIIGDVWVNTDEDIVYFWDGSTWIATGGAGGSTVAYQSSSPSSPEVGTLWIDSDSEVSLLTTEDLALKENAAQGGGSDAVFYENDQIVNSDYTITSGRNAGSFGPITIGASAAVTIPSGSVWSII